MTTTTTTTLMTLDNAIEKLDEFGPNCLLGICCPPSAQEELFAKMLHEAGREAVERNLVVRRDVPTKGFVEWVALDEFAKEGRLLQARYILERVDIAPKDSITPLLRAAGKLAVDGTLQLRGWL